MARKSLEEQLEDARAAEAKAAARTSELEKRIEEKRKRMFARAEKTLGRTLREDELAAALELVLSGAVARSDGADAQDEPDADGAQNPADEELGAGAKRAPRGTAGHAPESVPSAQMSIDEVMADGGQ